MVKEINMSEREVSRADVFSDVSRKKISQIRAAEILGISPRHMRRLYADFVKSGLYALVSKQRGKPSNHQLPAGLSDCISELVTIPLYSGFGPTFMCEKLSERHEVKVSVETIRKLMILKDVWEANKKRCPIIHQQRKRRARRGELVQIDGSPHAWFEDRGEPCVLISFVDDATGHTYGRFFKSETTFAYMLTSLKYFMKYGRPLAYYSDKHSIFRINQPGCLQKELITQFGRACKELDIGTICANSPQAKGRVERNNQTQQDRLIKELRLRGISTIEKANQFLEDNYWEMFNKKFSVPPESPENAHRKLLPEHNLKKILSHKEQRVLSKNLEFQYENVVYQIEEKNPSWSLRRARITVIKGLEGQMYVEYKGRNLPFKTLDKQRISGEIVDSKGLDTFFKEKKVRKVSANHIWNQQGRAQKLQRKYKNI